jgi:hypothetical protein
MRRSLAAARGEARPVASARLGSGRSRFAALQRRIRLEARARAKAAIRPHDSVRKSFPTSLWKLWKTPIVEPQAHAGFRAARSGDITTLCRTWGHPNGGRPEKSSERARTSRAPSKRLSPPRRSYRRRSRLLRQRERRPGGAALRVCASRTSLRPRRSVRAYRILRNRSACSSP